MRRQDIIDARVAVDDAIDLLNQVPRNYGGHLSTAGSSTLDGLPEVGWYRHDDGRVLRLIRVLDDEACIVANENGKHIVVPIWKLSAVWAI